MTGQVDLGESFHLNLGSKKCHYIYYGGPPFEKFMKQNFDFWGVPLLSLVGLQGTRSQVRYP